MGLRPRASLIRTGRVSLTPQAFYQALFYHALMARPRANPSVH